MTFKNNLNTNYFYKNNMDKQKNCTLCKILKPLLEFPKDRQKSDGFRSECKICKNNRDKIYRDNNKTKIKKIQKKYYDRNSDKIKLNAKSWYNNNKTRAKDSKKKWHNDNKVYVDFLRAKHLENNREFYKEYQRRYQKKRYHTDINYRIKTCINKRLRDYVRNKKFPTLKYLDIPMKEFKKWIEFQFEENMTWENFGKGGWSFDHVIPCDSFDLSKEKQIFKCYNWKNLRPCWIPENSSKKNKIIPKLIARQEKNINLFIEERYCF